MKPRGSYARYVVVRTVFLAIDLCTIVPLTLLALLSRLARRPIAVGLGPTPIINSVYHKKALVGAGWSAETFVDSVWHVTSEFDYRVDRLLPGKLAILRPYFLFVRSLFRYRAIYTYFSGGSLRTTTLLATVEPILLKLAGIRTVVLAFGSDVQDLTRTNNKLFIHGMGLDYPTHRFLRRHIARCVDSWTLWADHVVGGCDWVDYMYFWDTLMVSHFAIDTEDWVPLPTVSRPNAPLRIIHAPNHRAVKGTEAVLRAVAELQAEGVAIELELLEGKPNHEVRAAIAAADLVVDQLVVGWYAMFAIEGMALGKPVVCYLRDDLLRFYTETGVLAGDEVPLINADVLSIKERLRHFATDRSALPEIGRRGRDYVVARHSVPVIGAAFDRINRAIGL